ncbi:ATP-dependent DNA ligase [Streptomyces flaveolus]|uniref:ATP-dependent DNA ligase n=1 Tax=Streptomyces flaveolus TaxID=67297 RepID=UPI0036FEEAF9
MTWMLPEPMLTTSVAGPDLPPGFAAEPKRDGYRAQLGRFADGRVLLRSRQGTDMTGAFPEIRDAALAQLPDNTALDGELVVWESDRLAFDRLQQRLARRRGAGALAAARTWPAHCVVFDLLRLDGVGLTAWPYARRRAALEDLFADACLSAPFTLCPSTTDPAIAREWLTWTTVGMEGSCFKRLGSSPVLAPGRGRSTRFVPPPMPSSVRSPAPPSHRARCCSVGTTTKARCATSAGRPPSPAHQRPRSRKR